MSYCEHKEAGSGSIFVRKRILLMRIRANPVFSNADGCEAFWTGPPYEGDGPFCEVYGPGYAPVSTPTEGGVLYTIKPAGVYNIPTPLEPTVF
jgi:hypothetical protein